MEGIKSFFVLFLLSTFTTTVFSASCYGGSIVHTTVVGGTSDDYLADAAYSDNEIISVGYTASWDFPYDLSYTSSVIPYDVILTVSSTVNTSDVFNILTGSFGTDTSDSIDLDGEYFCIAGKTDSPGSFPTNSPYSDYYYPYSVPFLFIGNKTANPPYRIFSQLVGDVYDVDEVYVACSAKHQTAFVVSTSGYGNTAKRSETDYDVRISTYDINDGSWLSNDYFGGEGQDYVSDTEFYERGTDKFLMIVGTTLSSGINDSFPISTNAFQTSNNGNTDVFIWVANMNNYTNISWQFATFFGGSSYEDVYDVAIDESGNTWILGGSVSGNLPLQNAWDSSFCGNIEQPCMFLTVFNFQGQVLLSTWLGTIETGGALDVSRLSDGGHLVYIATRVYMQENMDTVEAFPYNDNTTENYVDTLIMVYYVNAQFTSASLRLKSPFGGTGYESIGAITVLPNNQFALSGFSSSIDLPPAGNYSEASDYNTFTTIFQCGSALYNINPSPTPAATLPPPSPPPASCESTGGCFTDVPGLWIQFDSGDDGEYVPSQTIYPGTEDSVDEDYWLAVEYLSLEERNANGDLIVNIPFPTSGYSVVSQSQVINGVNANVVTFSGYLLNGAGVDVIHYFFEEAGTLDFAGTTVAVEDSTSKVSLRISGWNFEDTSNTLTLTILLDISPPPKGPATAVPSGNQTQFSWDTGATDCRVTTLSLIEIDGGTGVANNSVTSAKIQVTLPYFSDYVLYDPGYAVLVKDDQKSSPKEEISPWAYVGAALGALVVVSAVVGIGYFLVSKQKRRTEKALSFKSDPKSEEEMK